MYLLNIKESLKYAVVRLRELSLTNSKRDDKAKQCITHTELNYKTWNLHCTFTQCISKQASMLERERNKFGYG